MYYRIVNPLKYAMNSRVPQNEAISSILMSATLFTALIFGLEVPMLALRNVPIDQGAGWQLLADLLLLVIKITGAFGLIVIIVSIERRRWTFAIAAFLAFPSFLYLFLRVNPVM